MTGTEIRRRLDEHNATVSQFARAMGIGHAMAERYASGNWDGKIPVAVHLFFRLVRYEPGILRHAYDASVRTKHRTADPDPRVKPARRSQRASVDAKSRSPYAPGRPADR